MLGCSGAAAGLVACAAARLFWRLGTGQGAADETVRRHARGQPLSERPCRSTKQAQAKSEQATPPPGARHPMQHSGRPVLRLSSVHCYICTRYLCQIVCSFFKGSWCNAVQVMHATAGLATAALFSRRPWPRAPRPECRQGHHSRCGRRWSRRSCPPPSTTAGTCQSRPAAGR